MAKPHLRRDVAKREAQLVFENDSCGYLFFDYFVEKRGLPTVRQPQQASLQRQRLFVTGSCGGHRTANGGATEYSGWGA